MEKKAEIKVRFKETYMQNPVTRVCHNMSEQDVINAYNLYDDDIEWFEFV